MEANSVQVHELHKKFEVLNDEIAQALRHQEDAINSTAAVTGSSTTTTASRKNVMRLTTRAIDWREDVNALAKHIDLQLQNSRALRSREAEVISRDGDTKHVEDDDSAKMRCLRSDLRLLQGFRLAHVHATPAVSDGKAFATMLEMLDAEGKSQKDLIDQSIKAEKSGRKEIQAAMIVQLFEARRELMGKISEEILTDTKQLDQDGGLSDLLGPTNASRDGGGVSSDKDILASLDAQLYLRLVRGLLEFEKELKARFSDGVYAQQPQLEHTASSAPPPEKDDEQPSSAGPKDNQAALKSPRSSFSSAQALAATSGKPSGPAPSLDEVNFALQKLRRDHVELKQSHAKLAMAHAQREDDLAHLQRKYDDEKRAHLNEKKWYVPKIQKLEETVVTTARAFEALKLNVELLTNMYKTLRQTLATHEIEEDELKNERDRVTALLSDEIKKVALLTKENARREKLVLIAMSARHEMCAAAKHSEARMKVLETEKLAAEQRAKECSEELAVLKVQLQCAYGRLEATDTALGAAKEMIERLQSEMDVCVAAWGVKEAELITQHEKDTQALQQRFDKTKRELMDAMSQNLTLDGRLRKAQEKLNKLTGDKPKDGETAAATKVQ